VKNIVVCKAEPIGTREVESLCIHVEADVAGAAVGHEPAIVLDADATVLAATLRKHLPQGTLHRLVAHLLRDTASDFFGSAR